MHRDGGFQIRVITSPIRRIVRLIELVQVIPPIFRSVKNDLPTKYPRRLVQLALLPRSPYDDNGSKNQGKGKGAVEHSDCESASSLLVN